MDEIQNKWWEEQRRGEKRGEEWEGGVKVDLITTT